MFCKLHAQITLLTDHQPHSFKLTGQPIILNSMWDLGSADGVQQEIFPQSCFSACVNTAVMILCSMFQVAITKWSQLTEAVIRTWFKSQNWKLGLVLGYYIEVTLVKLQRKGLDKNGESKSDYTSTEW